MGLEDMQTADNKKSAIIIYFSPQAPGGKESNWIPTGEDFFLIFRLYGPERKDFFPNLVFG